MDRDLVVTVYLNQRIVFDLVAMLQGGIATVTRLETSQESAKTQSDTSKTGFSVADAFGSLLKISLGGSRSRKAEDSQRSSIEEERTHTPASLFAALRDEINARGMIVDSTQRLPKPGEFVEFTASLQKNPLIGGLESIVEVLGLAGLFIEPHGSKLLSKPGKAPPNQAGELAKLGKQLNGITDSLKSGGTLDLIAHHIGSRARAVLTLERQFLGNPNMSDLIDGTFRVLGKVIRSIESPDDSISLIRNAPISVAPNIVEKLVESFENLSQIPGFNVPHMEINIEGPVIQVIPVAIFS